MKENAGQVQKLTRSVTSLWAMRDRDFMVPVMGCTQRHIQSICNGRLCPQGRCPKLPAAMLVMQDVNRWVLTLSDGATAEMHLLWVFSFLAVFIEGFTG